LVTLDKMSEEALKIIIAKYDGNPSCFVEGNGDVFPDYMRLSIKNIINTLENKNLITSGKNYLRGSWSAILTPDGLSYFEQKTMEERRVNNMFDRLPSNERDELRKILDSENPVEMLQKRFENISFKEEGILRGILASLCNAQLIDIFWADDVPQELTITNWGRTYFEREEYNEENSKNVSFPRISIGTINASDSNFIFGDNVNSAINLERSIGKIETKIDQEGGDEKEDMKAILQEMRNIIDEITLTGTIPQNTGWTEKIGNHLHKHEWFYGAVISLLGKAVLQKIQ